MGEPINPNSFLTRPGFIDGYHISVPSALRNVIIPSSALSRPLTKDEARIYRTRDAILVSVGLLLGFAASLVLNQLIKSLLFAVSTTDPLVYLIMATLVIVITLIASSLPARRATKIDPMRTLRSD